MINVDIGEYKGQIDIIPSFAIYLHNHNWDNEKDKKFNWHFHISIQWIIYYFEITIGKEDGE
ncbi:MAG: hypothetical protein PHF86_08445 [Candidatus Nanoarchaeia archaeon]|jgi:hypothetical protein|nr:hypothetical protein [Candidatus Nanoarchaeia archaeon]